MTRGSCCSTAVVISCRATGRLLSNVAYANQADRFETCLAGLARHAFGRAGPNELRRAAFVLAEVPIAAVRPHLERREPPPPLVDDLISKTYCAIVGSKRSDRAS